MTPSPPPEPYRLFFPLGVALGFLGVSVWPLYYLGWGVTPSPAGHVGLQIQGFVFSFAVGFLLTAVPRLVGSPPVRLGPQLVLAGLLLTAAAGFWLDRHRLAQAAFLAALAGLGLLGVAALRRRVLAPPPPFAAVGLGLLSGLAGSGLQLGVLLHALDPDLLLLGRRLLSEGMILLFVLGIGAKLGPTFLGHPPSTGASASLHAAAAILVLASLVGEYGLGIGAFAWLRAAIVAGTLAGNAKLRRAPATRSALSWGFWLAHWMLVAGLIWGAAVPAQRVEALHLVFVGGFSVLILVVGMRVTLAHGGYPLAWEVGSWPLRISVALFLVATLARVGARFAPDSYLLHLALAGVLWMLGLAVWGAVLVRRIAAPWRDKAAVRQDHDPKPAARRPAGSSRTSSLRLQNG